jgi:CRISPR/Cas system-associated protein Cas5 (RAMP superfamily)
MSKVYSFLKEEYLPGALFIKVSFKRDREELASRFSGYTPDYLVEFETQITKVKLIQQTLVLTAAQKQATVNLYLRADRVNVEFNPNSTILNEPPTVYENAEYWKDKYLKLLEEYNLLLKQG